MTLDSFNTFTVTAGLENCTRPLVFTSGSSVRASGNCHLLARQDEKIFFGFDIIFEEKKN